MTQRIPIQDAIEVAWLALNRTPLPKSLAPMYAPTMSAEAVRKRAARAKKEARRWHDVIFGPARVEA